MSTFAIPTTVNRPVVGALWCLTLFALIPFPNLGYMLVGAAANLAANGMALYLLCSRSKVNRVHGFVRLGFQVMILIVGVVVLARSGVSLEGFARYVTHRTV